MTEAPSSYDPLLPLRRALIFWRVCLLLPFGYLGLGMLIEHFLFRDGRAGGMLNLRGGAFHAAASLAGGVVVGVEIVVILLKKTFARRIRTPDLAGERMAMLYWLRTLYLAGAADFVSALGLVLFILSGSWGSLVFLCGLSYLFYAQAYPRARFLAE